MNAKKTTAKAVGKRGRPATKSTARKPAARKPAAKAAARKPAAKAATRKTATRKTAARKTAAKAATKATARKPASKKTAALQNPEDLDVSKFLPDIIPDSEEEKRIIAALEKTLRSIPKLLERDDARRPTPNPQVPPNFLDYMVQEFDLIRIMLEAHSANIRPLDRKRLNSIGIQKQGFVDRAYAAASENTRFMPPYLTIEKYSGDFNYYNRLRIILELLGQLREFLWNLVIQAADVTYTDSLEFYATIREAAERRIDGSESIFNELKPYFESRGNSPATGEEEPTEMELKRDVNALLHGKHDGEVIIRNVKPKIQAGERQIIDKKFTGSERIKDSKEAEIDE